MWKIGWRGTFESTDNESTNYSFIWKRMINTRPRASEIYNSKEWIEFTLPFAGVGLTLGVLYIDWVVTIKINAYKVKVYSDIKDDGLVALTSYHCKWLSSDSHICQEYKNNSSIEGSRNLKGFAFFFLLRSILHNYGNTLSFCLSDCTITLKRFYFFKFWFRERVKGDLG